MCMNDNLLLYFKEGENVPQHTTPLQYIMNRAGVKVW